MPLLDLGEDGPPREPYRVAARSTVREYRALDSGDAAVITSDNGR